MIKLKILLPFFPCKSTISYTFVSYRHSQILSHSSIIRHPSNYLIALKLKKTRNNSKMYEGDKISISPIVTNVQEMVDLHEKRHKKYKFYHR